MENIAEIYGSKVFDDREMKKRLSSETYNALKATIREGRDIDINIANDVAKAMGDWAIQQGATHYTHWFQPMTGATAEKHEAFINPKKDGTVLMGFSGKELIKGEPDASSFPSGGLRATFEARGYTAWDPTSFAFIKEDTLCIPTAFCSFSGAILDKKTPLLRSMEALSEQAIRVLRLFGNKEVKQVRACVGLEQEYFLVDKALFNKRRDLKFCGRTLLGTKPPKGQELEDHYFGAIKPRVAQFMKDIDMQLWRYGIPAKTEHNETAPSQHELASVFDTANLSIDRNLLIMEVMRNTADKYGLSCILHEKPFEGVNGSGKHNNWSLSTDNGTNLFEPGESPLENAQFLLFLTAVIKAVDDYQDLLRATVASPSNDRRLGGDEAPPAIISMFLGDELTQIMESLVSGASVSENAKESMVLGVHVLPSFPKDGADRNRTSPFAFTGNKFEFRAPGSSINGAGPNIAINTAVANSLSEFADILENADDFDKALTDLVRSEYLKHKRIIYNGNNYSKEWYAEASRRGLSNLGSCAEAAGALVSPKSLELFGKFGIFTEEELTSRCGIVLGNYSKTLNIEATTMLEMVRGEVIPASIEFSKVLAEGINAKATALGIAGGFDLGTEKSLLSSIQKLISLALMKVPVLEDALAKAKKIDDISKKAMFYSKTVIPAMNDLRDAADGLEVLVGRKYWPYPTYEDLLFSV